MPVDLRPGIKVKNYTLERQLGKGASGEVWKAYDSQKSVAIKFMNENLMTSPSAAKHRARLEREVEAMRRLQHPNIPTLFDYDLDFPRPYIAMRYVGGDSYDKLIATGDMLRVPLMRRIELIRELAYALEAAHDYGIVHRDIKPSNLTGIENPFLLDFSVALEREDVDMTQSFIGTTLYMAPDTEADRLSDNYGFALVSYEMLFGKHAIYRHGDKIFNQIVAADRINKGDWAWPSKIAPAELPQDMRAADLRRLDEIFGAALGKRENRYKDLRDFVRDLRDAIYPEMKSVVAEAEEDYIPTMMMPAIPVTPQPAPQPAQAAPPEDAGTIVMPAPVAAAPPPPAPQPAAPVPDYEAKTVPQAEHKTTPYDPMAKAVQPPPEIIKTELDVPAAHPSPGERTELETPAAPAQAAPSVPAAAPPAQPNYTMMEFQSAQPQPPAAQKPPLGQADQGYTMMEFQAAAPPHGQVDQGYTMMEFQAAAPPQGQPNQGYTMMEFQAAQPGQGPANANYTMMQMQAAPGAFAAPVKARRSPLKIVLLLFFFLLAIAVVTAVVLIATGNLTIG
jgi:serine/threonine-protein kinase